MEIEQAKQVAEYLKAQKLWISAKVIESLISEIEDFRGMH